MGIQHSITLGNSRKIDRIHVHGKPMFSGEDYGRTKSRTVTQNPGFASWLWLDLINKSTLVKVRKKYFQSVKQSKN